MATIPSSLYWRIREQQHAKEMMARDKDYSEEIKKIYSRNYGEIQRTINDFYIRYADKNGLSIADAKKKVSSFDVQAYADKAKQWVKERNFSKEANETLELYNATMKINRLELLKSEIGLYLANNGDELDKYIYQTLTDEAKAEALRQAGILGETLKTMSAEDIDAIVKGSHKVDISNTAGQSTFSERIWGHNQALKNNLDNLLTQSLINGKHPNVLARDLMKQFNASRYEAERLMRTESARVQGAVQLENAVENGYDYYEIVASPGCCSVCAAMDGKVFRVSDAEVGTNMYPFHPNCRCSAAVSTGKASNNRFVTEGDIPEPLPLSQIAPEIATATEPTGLVQPKEVTVSNRNYDSQYAQKLTKSDYDAIHDIIDKSGNSDLVKIWNKYESDVEVGGTRSKKNQYAVDNKIYFDKAAARIGNQYEYPYEIALHETAHAIDYLAYKRSGGSSKSSASGNYVFGLSGLSTPSYANEYKNGIFAKTLTKEIGDRVNKHDVVIQKHINDIDWLYKNGYLPKWNYEYYKNNGMVPTDSKDIAYHAVSSEIRKAGDGKAIACISDMVEAATGARVSTGFGHGRDYWLKSGAQAAEAFAEMTEATFTNPESLAIIKEYVPESYKIYEEMIADIAKG